MPTYITADEVRIACGAPSSLISDADVNETIDLAEALVEKWLNTTFTPTTQIDILDGNGFSWIYPRKSPLLSVRTLKTNDTSITLTGLKVYRESGKVDLHTGSETATFLAKKRSVIIKYLYGTMEESSTSTTTDADASAGTSVTVSVVSESGFTANDWVDIYGMDGYKETAQVSSTATGELVIDQLAFDHESGSTVVKLQCPIYVKRKMLVEAGLIVALNAIGATYTFNASYSLGDLSVTKGVPYTHWRESVEKLLKEREFLSKVVRPRPSIGVGVTI